MRLEEQNEPAASERKAAERQQDTREANCYFLRCPWSQTPKADCCCILSPGLYMDGQWQGLVFVQLRLFPKPLQLCSPCSTEVHSGLLQDPEQASAASSGKGTHALSHHRQPKRHDYRTGGMLCQWQVARSNCHSTPTLGLIMSGSSFEVDRMKTHSSFPSQQTNHLKRVSS